MIDILRTPDERFADLPGFDFAPNYLDQLAGYEGLRCHYLDLGPKDAANTFLCLHGQPTWSYLYRKMIPILLASGARVVAPDFFGFGRSDKPVEDAVYTYEFHRNMLVELVGDLDLSNITLVCQDWGGLLGLTLPMEMPDRFKRLLVMNTAFGAGDMPLGDGFVAWRQWCRDNPDMAVGKLMGRSCPQLSAAEIAAYDAPYPDVTYKAGVRRFPELVPDNPDAGGAKLSRAARDWFNNEWQGETFMAVGMQDPVLGPPAMAYLKKQIKNCPDWMAVEDGGHFVQENGEEVAKAALAAFGD